jgi:hypothetical protein
MGDFNWTISPGVSKPTRDQTLADPLLITIDGIPEATDVLLRMIETDIWSLPGGRTITEGKGSFEVFASFTGEIKKGKFKVAKFNALRNSKTALKIKITFDGDNRVFECPIHDDTDEEEGGYLEISLNAVFTMNGKVLAYPQQNRKPQPPVAVRSILTKRPVLAYITDVDRRGSPNEFFRAARDYFRNFSDEIRDNGRPFPVGDIMENLRSSTGILGEINIVTHALHGKLGLRAQSNTEPGITTADLEEMVKEKRHPLLEPISNKIVDKDTLLVIRGCEAGNDQRMLDLLAILFAGDVGKITVLAPKFIQVYEQAKEFFDENFEFFFKDPGGKSPLPTLDVCRAEIRKDTANANKDLSRIRIERHAREHDKRPFDLKAANRRDFKNPKGDKDFEKFARENDDNFPDESENFSWHATGIAKQKDGTVTKFTLIGQRLFITCRQRLATKVTKPNGKVEFVPIIPDIRNFDHYGRSPALKELPR